MSGLGASVYPLRAVRVVAVGRCRVGLALLRQSVQSKPVSFSERFHSRSMTGLS